MRVQRITATVRDTGTALTRHNQVMKGTRRLHLKRPMVSIKQDTQAKARGK